jgi:hypothetical protein
VGIGEWVEDDVVGGTNDTAFAEVITTIGTLGEGDGIVKLGEYVGVGRLSEDSRIAGLSEGCRAAGLDEDGRAAGLDEDGRAAGLDEDGRAAGFDEDDRAGVLGEGVDEEGTPAESTIVVTPVPIVIVQALPSFGQHVHGVSKPSVS